MGMSSGRGKLMILIAAAMLCYNVPTNTENIQVVVRSTETDGGKRERLLRRADILG